MLRTVISRIAELLDGGDGGGGGQRCVVQDGAGWASSASEEEDEEEEEDDELAGVCVVWQPWWSWPLRMIARPVRSGPDRPSRMWALVWRLKWFCSLMPPPWEAGKCVK